MDKFSREAVYVYVWEKCKTRARMINKTQKQIGDELGIPLRSMQNIWRDLIEQGLIVKKYNKFYATTDPATFQWQTKESLTAVEAICNFFDVGEDTARQFIKYLAMKDWLLIKND